MLTTTTADAVAQTPVSPGAQVLARGRAGCSAVREPDVVPDLVRHHRLQITAAVGVVEREPLGAGVELEVGVGDEAPVRVELAGLAVALALARARWERPACAERRMQARHVQSRAARTFADESIRPTIGK